MMKQSIESFFHDFRQEVLSGSEASNSFQLWEFMEIFANELTESGFVEGFELCYFSQKRSMRIDGYWFNDEGTLDLFIADFDSRNEMSSLPKTDVDAAFNRLSRFVEASLIQNLAADLEVTSPEYGLAKQIADRRETITSLNLVLFSERVLSGRVQTIPAGMVVGIPATYHVWDLSRLSRLRSAQGQKEALDLNFIDMFGHGIPSLVVNAESQTYQAYLLVMPADILATIYEKYGARLLEQNVRTFLQARGNVNKGIRGTILNEPEMFFAYNNGLTATAQGVETQITSSGVEVTRIVDLQIVNGGQTTASLFLTRKRDKADLKHIFVQIKLAVIEREHSEKVVPKISEYANTQNKVNAADFFSNHPFHIRMEEFSRRLWAPAVKGSQRESKWFYERARGQYSDAQATFTLAEQKRFRIEHPKHQMFTKTDLAKFENVWDEHPRWVNLGAQKNFAQYAVRIGRQWDKSSDEFNEFYFKRAIARGILFRATERIVSSQTWYNGGYRANIVAYTLAILGEITKRKNRELDYSTIWNIQYVDDTLEKAIATAAELVKDAIIHPPSGISNVSEWCKREACWLRIMNHCDKIERILQPDFFSKLISFEEMHTTERDAIKTQKIDNGIEIQRYVLNIASADWMRLYKLMQGNGTLTTKEEGVLRIATQIPVRIPTEKQSAVLINLLSRAKNDGFMLS